MTSPRHRAFWPCVVLLASCRSTPSEPAPSKEEPAKTAPAVESAKPQPPAPTPPPGPKVPARPVATVPVSPDDPLKGVFTLADATQGISGSGALIATID